MNGGSGGTSRVPRAGWSDLEDSVLLSHIEQHGAAHWGILAKALLEQTGRERTAKSCRLRWYNELHPSIDKSPLTAEEMSFIMREVAQRGTRWSDIVRAMVSAGFPRRTDNQIKNTYHVKLKKKMEAETGRKHIDFQQLAARQRRVRHAHAAAANAADLPAEDEEDADEELAPFPAGEAGGSNSRPRKRSQLKLPPRPQPVLELASQPLALLKLEPQPQPQLRQESQASEGPVSSSLMASEGSGNGAATARSRSMAPSRAASMELDTLASAAYAVGPTATRMHSMPLLPMQLAALVEEQPLRHTGGKRPHAEQSMDESNSGAVLHTVAVPPPAWQVTRSLSTFSPGPSSMAPVDACHSPAPGMERAGGLCPPQRIGSSPLSRSQLHLPMSAGGALQECGGRGLLRQPKRPCSEAQLQLQALPGAPALGLLGPSELHGEGRQDSQWCMQLPKLHLPELSASLQRFASTGLLPHAPHEQLLVALPPCDAAGGGFGLGVVSAEALQGGGSVPVPVPAPAAADSGRGTPTLSDRTPKSRDLPVPPPCTRGLFTGLELPLGSPAPASPSVQHTSAAAGSARMPRSASGLSIGTSRGGPVCIGGGVASGSGPLQAADPRARSPALTLSGQANRRKPRSMPAVADSAPLWQGGLGFSGGLAPIASMQSMPHLGALALGPTDTPASGELCGLGSGAAPQAGGEAGVWLQQVCPPAAGQLGDSRAGLQGSSRAQGPGMLVVAAPAELSHQCGLWAQAGQEAAADLFGLGMALDRGSATFNTMLASARAATGGPGPAVSSAALAAAMASGSGSTSAPVMGGGLGLSGNLLALSHHPSSLSMSIARYSNSVAGSDTHMCSSADHGLHTPCMDGGTADALLPKLPPMLRNPKVPGMPLKPALSTDADMLAGEEGAMVKLEGAWAGMGAEATGEGSHSELWDTIMWLGND